MPCCTQLRLDATGHYFATRSTWAARSAASWFISEATCWYRSPVIVMPEWRRRELAVLIPTPARTQYRRAARRVQSEIAAMPGADETAPVIERIGAQNLALID